MPAPVPFSNPLLSDVFVPPSVPTLDIQRPAPDHFPDRPLGPDSKEVESHWRVSLLRMAEAHLPIQKRLVHAGDAIYRQGDPFSVLHLIHAGLFKLVNRFQDGRERIVHFGLKGDWLGFDGMACGIHDCDAIALDTGEIWSISYDAIQQQGATHPALLGSALACACRELVEGRALTMSLCTLPARARVAQFLRNWAQSLELRGLRSDCIKLYLSREEIGTYLGLTLETVSRALTQLAKDGLILFTGSCRRDITIPDMAALDDFIRRSVLSTAEVS